MATQEKTWNVANRLHSLKDSDNPEVNHIIAGADEIYDDAKGAKQSDINAQTDAALADRYTKSETYSKEQLDSLITTPDVNYVTVATFADLPQTGEADTIYRVSFYDGTQVDASKYALYAWNGATYQLLAVRSAVGEVFDVSEYNTGATYETLTAALAAVPAAYHRGGMSIKFISGSKYVQYRLMATAWTNDISYWQGIDEEPTAGSRNLVQSGGVFDAVKNNSPIISFDGAGTTIAGNTGMPALKGHTYRIYMFQTSWDFGTTTDNHKILGVGYQENGTNVFTNEVIYQYRSIIASYYDVEIPSSDAERYILLNGRAAVGVTVRAFIDDITISKDVPVNTANITKILNGIAPAWASGVAQAIGDYVNYNGYFYVCEVAHTTGSTFASANYTRVSIDNIIHKDIPRIRIPKTEAVGYEQVRYGLVPYTFIGGHTYLITIEGLNGKRTVSVAARNKSDQSSAGSIQTLVNKKGDGSYKATFDAANDDSFYVAATLQTQSDTEAAVALPTIYVYDVTDVLTVVNESVSTAIAPLDTKIDNLDVEVNGPEWKRKPYNGYYNGTKWTAYNTALKYTFYIVPVKPGDVIQVVANSTRHNILSEFSYTASVITTASVGSIALSANTEGAAWNKVGSFTYTAGADAKCLMFYTVFNEANHRSVISINDVEVWPVIEGLYPEVEDLENRVSSLEGDDSVVSLNGGLTELTDKFQALCKRKGTSSDVNAGNKILNLLYFSDLHNGTGTLERIIGFKNTFSSYIDDMLHGGDMVQDQFYQDNPFATVDGGSDVLTVIGNHDNWDSKNIEGDSVNGRALPTKVFAKFIAPYYEGWGVTIPTGAAENGYCYWYKDYTESKVRLVALNCMVWDNTQASWLEDVLDDAIENDLAVMIVNHYCPHEEFHNVRSCTFCEVYSENSGIYATHLDNAVAGIVQDAIDGGLQFICWLFGHHHKDIFGYLTDYPSQYAIAVDKPVPNSNWERDTVRLTTGKTQDAFNIITVDTTLGVLSVMRIGNNRDKFMRQKNFLAFDYVNKVIVGNS